MRPINQRVLVTEPIANEGIDKLKKFGFEIDIKIDPTEQELSKIIGDYEVFIVRSRTKVTTELIAEAKKLKLIARAGVGVDNIDLKAAREAGIAVINAPESVANAVAELVFGLIFAILRKIPLADRLLRGGRWEKQNLLGHELRGKKVGVIGFGRIGQILDSRLHSFQCECLPLIYDPFVKKEAHKYGVMDIVELDALYRTADIITLHAPLTPETQNMINKTAFEKMKDGVIIINTSRGEIINEDDLYEALLSGKVGGAGIDTWTHEPPIGNKLLKLDTVVATQHLGASTFEAQRDASLEIANYIINAFQGKTFDDVLRGKIKLI